MKAENTEKNIVTKTKKINITMAKTDQSTQAVGVFHLTNISLEAKKDKRDWKRAEVIFKQKTVRLLQKRVKNIKAQIHEAKDEHRQETINRHIMVKFMKIREKEKHLRQEKDEE